MHIRGLCCKYIHATVYLCTWIAIYRIIYAIFSHVYNESISLVLSIQRCWVRWHLRSALLYLVYTYGHYRTTNICMYIYTLCMHYVYIYIYIYTYIYVCIYCICIVTYVRGMYWWYLCCCGCARVDRSLNMKASVYSRVPLFRCRCIYVHIWSPVSNKLIFVCMYIWSNAVPMKVCIYLCISYYAVNVQSWRGGGSWGPHYIWATPPRYKTSFWIIVLVCTLFCFFGTSTGPT